MDQQPQTNVLYSEEAERNDGCISLGCSSGRNELVLVANGEFAGEVWSDRLGYGAAMRGCFGAAGLLYYLS